MALKQLLLNLIDQSVNIDKASTITLPMFQLKALKSRQLEAEKIAEKERVKETEKANIDREQLERTSRAVTGINHLEIPAELAFIFSKLDGNPN